VRAVHEAVSESACGSVARVEPLVVGVDVAELDAAGERVPVAVAEARDEAVFDERSEGVGRIGIEIVAVDVAESEDSVESDAAAERVTDALRDALAEPDADAEPEADTLLVTVGEYVTGGASHTRSVTTCSHRPL
jgi:hypothetical protein